MADELMSVEHGQQDIVEKKEELFQRDTELLGRCTAEFVENFYPAYSIMPSDVGQIKKEDSLQLLNSFTFYKLSECTVDDVEDLFVYFAEKMQKLFTSAYSIKQEVCYGIVSDGEQTSLVVGIAPTSNDTTIRCIIEGLLPGMKVEEYTNRFVNAQTDRTGEKLSYDKDRYVGCISGVPALKIDGEYKTKDLSSIMRSLNGANYTIMVLCKPIEECEIQNKLNEAIKIQDQCFAISKRTISSQKGTSQSSTHTDTHSESDGTQESKTKGRSVSGVAAAAGAAIGSIIPVVGTVVGAAVGAVGGRLIELLVGNRSKTTGTTHSLTDGYSDSVTNTINSSESISADVQNGFAVELMKMAENVSDRLRIGRSIGMWESVITYSSDSEIASKIIQGSLYSEVASGIPEVLPPVVFSYKDSCFEHGKLRNVHSQQLLIPEGFFNGATNSPLCSLVTSEELCGICTIPIENTIGFEIKKSKAYSINKQMGKDDISIGKVCEYDRPLSNMNFGLSEEDLNKHTFVCGITGSGKTNTVKHILESVEKPFLVIEPAKKEYRNLMKNVNVFSLGRPEINCIKLNPFYILPGISPQQHIDLLKDLFSVSFGFYGPMPYILEKCLYNIYTKKGWNLTLGFHPCLTGRKGLFDLFREDIIKEKYAFRAHKYLFPTMQDLKNEVDYYIEHEMTYEGEVKGNIRSAIKARIDSLCIGAKGFMFNTFETSNFDELLSQNTVLELEGLADDADKAFALGLLIMYVNEYRQVQKEVNHIQGLTHVLVIEEAHRLLKNVSTESNEDMGNPKGKAVDHFTNMLAEMRAYGQGVIVAEQIPSKLAPDVIKNSSNKIIHRIVAMDDQEAVANTIGVEMDHAIYLGNQKVGYALCHKEGMVQPVIVKIDEVTKRNITDTNLYEKDVETKLFHINKSIISNQLPKEVSVWAVKTLVSLLNGSSKDEIYNGIELAVSALEKLISLKTMTMIPGISKKDCIVSSIIDSAISLLLAGGFSNHIMPSDELVETMENTIKVPTTERIKHLQELFEKFYQKRPETKAAELVACLASDEYAAGYKIDQLTNDFLFFDNADFVKHVKLQFRG